MRVCQTFSLKSQDPFINLQRVGFFLFKNESNYPYFNKYELKADNIESS